MRLVAVLALAVGSMSFASVSNASERFARGEKAFVIPVETQSVTDTAPVVEGAPDQVSCEKWSARRVAEEISKDSMTKYMFFISEEIKYINRNRVVDEEGEQMGVDAYGTDTPVYAPGTKLKVPVYVPKDVPCGDIRNWHVAVLKGSKYGVSPRLLLGIRSAENPHRDNYAYGVLCQKGTNLWTQAEWSAKIVRRILGKNAMSPMGHIGALRVGYVCHSAPAWEKTVPYIYRISLYETH